MRLIRKGLLRCILILLVLLYIVPAAFAQNAISHACSVYGEDTLLIGRDNSDGTFSFYVETVNFFEGDTLTLTVTQPYTEWEVIANTTSLASGITVASYTYTIPEESTLTHEVIITGATPNTTVTANCDPAEPDDGDTEVSDGTICHRPPGNPEAAHTITVGLPAVHAHLAHGDSLGVCPPGVQTRHDDFGDGIVVYILPIRETISIYGICVDGNCTLIADFNMDDLLDAIGTIDEGEYIKFDNDEADDWVAHIYYLGYQDREGDGSFGHVFQINIYVANTLWNDDVLIVINDDETFYWTTNP
jgi:hypothetical protein